MKFFAKYWKPRLWNECSLMRTSSNPECWGEYIQPVFSKPPGSLEKKQKKKAGKWLLSGWLCLHFIIHECFVINHVKSMYVSILSLLFSLIFNSNYSLGEESTLLLLSINKWRNSVQGYLVTYLRSWWKLGAKSCVKFYTKFTNLTINHWFEEF